MYNTQLTNLAVNTEADAFAPLLNNGWIDCYGGFQPANGELAVSTQQLLVQFRFAATAFGAAVNGVLTANAIAAAMTLAAGDLVWFRAYKADHVTAVYDGSIGIIEANMVVSSVRVYASAQVQVATFTHTIAKSTMGS